jgi:hypothetical protein
MLFKKLLKRQAPVPVKASQGSDALGVKTMKSADKVMSERRRFPRPLPLPEVVEHDWAVWVDVTQNTTPQKPDGSAA